MLRPATYTDIVSLLTDVEQLRVEPDSPAKVVIDEQTGVIVMGSNVRISTVAIAQGNLTIRVTETPQVSQPGPVLTVTSLGQPAIEGGWLSVTVTVKPHWAVTPSESVAVRVTVVVPLLKVRPVPVPEPLPVVAPLNA